MFLIRWTSNFSTQQTLQVQTIVCLLFFDFNGFWRENDVMRLAAKFYFHFMTKVIHGFDRTCWDKLKCEKLLKKLNWFKRYKDLNFEIPAILLLFLEIWQISTCNIFLINSHLKIIFSYLNSCQHIRSKSYISFVTWWKWNFAVSVMTSFSRQNPLKSKNKNHTIVWNCSVCCAGKF